MLLSLLAALICGTMVAGPSAAAGVGSSQIVPGSVNRTSLQITATYNAHVSISYATGVVGMYSDMVVTNASGGPIDRLELNTSVARVGAIRLRTFQVDGRTVTPAISDQTIRVPLGGVLPDGATARVRAAYRAVLRTSVSGSNWMFTRYQGIINAYRWLPWISRATTFNRPNYGDPFVTPTSPSVRVTFTTDRAMTLATSGHRVQVTNGGLTQVFVANNVRDFNFTASPFYRTTSSFVGSTRVTVYYRTGAAASTMLSRAKTALATFNSLAGAYPYPTFSVAQSAGGYAMESPALIWIPPVDSTRLAYLITHETAHQWFYGLVGNDQAREPFADEAMADFLTRYALASFRSSGCSSNTLDRTIYVYSYTCYYELIYVKGANVINQVRLRMGNTAFWSALRSYVTTYRGKLSHTSWLLKFLDDRTSADLRPIYRVYFPNIY